MKRNSPLLIPRFAVVPLAILSATTALFAQFPGWGTPTPPPKPSAKSVSTPMVLTAAPARYNKVINGPLRYDTEGRHINAHGGGVMFYNGTYYWYGEYRNVRQQGVPGTAGVGCYTSKDLYNWKNEGVVLETIKNDPDHDFTAGCVIERPKVIYNAKTGKFVMWFHLELKGKSYSAARAALAVGDKPLGPFKYIRSGRVNAGKWPTNMPEAAGEAVTTRRDFEGGQMSRDMTLYVDDDGKAYLLTSAEENYTFHIHELTDDFQDFTGKWARIVPNGHNEAPAMCKYHGKYYILCSAATGWDPNAARVLVADNIWGPYNNVGNPCEGTNPFNQMGANKTFGGQSTDILPVQGKRDAFIAMFDIWRPKVQLLESGYIWLPIEFKNDKMVIRWRNEWDLSAFAWH